jgi:hypothetical protein
MGSGSKLSAVQMGGGKQQSGAVKTGQQASGPLQIGTVSRQKTTLHCVEASLRRLVSTRTLPGRSSGVLLQKTAAQARRGPGVAVERCRSHGAPSSWQHQCPALLAIGVAGSKGSPVTLSASTVLRAVETAESGWATSEDKRRALEPATTRDPAQTRLRDLRPGESISSLSRSWGGKEGRIRGL